MKGWGYLLLVLLTAALTFGIVRSYDARQLAKLRASTAAERAAREALAASADSALAVADSAAAVAAALQQQADESAARRQAAERARQAAQRELAQARAELAAAALPPDTLRDRVIAVQDVLIGGLIAENIALRGELVPLRATLAAHLEQLAALRASLALTDSARLLAEARIAALERSIARSPADPCLIRWPTCVTLTVNGPTLTPTGIEPVSVALGVPIS